MDTDTPQAGHSGAGPADAANSELHLAWDLIEHTGCSLFLTGKAGTGKTTFLRRLREKSRKRIVVVAPTGIAAINAGGVTIHSFFQLPFSPFPPDRYPKGSYDRFAKDKLRALRSMDLLVIDEVSMVRADLLDAVDQVLRRYRDHDRPFGGVQLLLIGDLRQLPPVVKEDEMYLLKDYYQSLYFFESHALARLRYATVELQRVYRQSDASFLEILNRIRDNVADSATLDALNRRCIHGFRPEAGKKYIRLTTHNESARRINDAELARLPGEEWHSEATVKGKFPESSYPADVELRLKVGAQVMFIKNDTGGDRRFYNGMIGEVTELTPETVVVRSSDSAELITVKQDNWQNISYSLPDNGDEMKEVLEGEFMQFPLRLAWAITIHKSQGLTFEHAVIDASRSFAPGQAYVALSRCKTLEGLVLESPLTPTAVFVDRRVTDFINGQLSLTPDPERIALMKREYFTGLLDELFGMNMLVTAMADFLRVAEEAFNSLAPNEMNMLREANRALTGTLRGVSDSFRRQYTQMADVSPDPENDAALAGRIKAACGYFLKFLKDIRQCVEAVPDTSDNATLTKRLGLRYAPLAELLVTKICCMEGILEEGFSISGYQRRKSKALADHSETRSDSARRTSGRGKEPTVKAPSDVSNPELYRRLQLWRRSKMAELDVPAFQILSTKVLKSIADFVPADITDLLAVPGIGQKKVEAFGAEIIGIVNDFKAANKVSVTDENRATLEKRKEEKIPSHIRTVNMFNEGKSVEQICEERGFKSTTIIGHFIRVSEEGGFDLTRLMSVGEAREILNSIGGDAARLPLGEINRKYEIPYEKLKLAMTIEGITPVTMPEYQERLAEEEYDELDETDETFDRIMDGIIDRKVSER